MRNPWRSVEYNDNRISLYSGQGGKCAEVRRFHIGEIHCHHKTPKWLGRQLYREILAVADEMGGKLKKRCVFFRYEFGTLSRIESAERMFSAS